MTTISAQNVLVSCDAQSLAGRLVLPEHPRGVVVCADESADRCLLARQPELVGNLFGVGIGALQIELLTSDERADARTAALCRNHIELLARRLVSASDWLADTPTTSDLPIGYYGTGIGSAAAMIAAARRPAIVSAVVLIGGRPLLARPALPQVQAATLLVALSSEIDLIKVNRAALSQMRCEKCLELAETEETVPLLAKRWFEHCLVSTEASDGGVGDGPVG